MSYVKELRKLLESDLNNAEVLMAAKGITLELHKMIDKVSQLQNDTLLSVAEEIKDTHGLENAQAFYTSVDSSLDTVLDELKTAYTGVSYAVSALQCGDLGSLELETGSESDLDVEELEPDMDVELEDDLGDLEDLDVDLDDEEDLGRELK